MDSFQFRVFRGFVYFLDRFVVAMRSVPPAVAGGFQRNYPPVTRRWY